MAAKSSTNSRPSPSTYKRPKEGYAEITAHIPRLLKFRLRARGLELGMLLSQVVEEAAGYWLNEVALPVNSTKEVPTPGLQGVLWDILPTGLYRRIDEHRRAQQDSWSTVLLESLEAYADKIPIRVPRPEPDSGVHQRLATGS